MSLRERKKEKTRHQILRSARRRFERRGFAATTMAAVARDAQVATGTLYNYFTSKQSLLLGLWDDATQHALAQADEVVAAAGPDVASSCAALLRLYVEASTLFSRPVMREVMTSALSSTEEDFASLDRQMLAQLMQHLEAWRDAGRLAEDTDLEAAAGLLYGVATSQMLVFVYSDDVHMEDALRSVDQQVSMVFSGIGRPSRGARRSR
ncbi:MAG: TetR/AcrR family transcriptional regulator [Sandaracinaceae bacterium]